MASLDEVYGGQYGSKNPRPKLFNSPNRRTEGALDVNSKVIQDLAKSLPISTGGSGDDSNNYAPVKFDGPPQTKNQREPFGVQNYTPPTMPTTAPLGMVKDRPLRISMRGAAPNRGLAVMSASDSDRFSIW